MNGSNKSSFDFHSFIKRTDGYSSAGKLPYRSNSSIARSLPSPALLSLTSVLDALASRVGAILDTSSDALQTVADGFGAGGVVDGLADATASCADEASSGLGDAA
jgi:hypothetical protein